jgi:hypothetical protein
MIKLWRRLDRGNAIMRRAMYSLRVSDFRSTARYSLGMSRFGSGDDMNQVCAASRSDQVANCVVNYESLNPH